MANDFKSEDSSLLEHKEPGFDHIPDPHPQIPAATDAIDQAVDQGMDKLKQDFIGRNNKND